MYLSTQSFRSAKKINANNKCKLHIKYITFKISENKAYKMILKNTKIQ